MISKNIRLFVTMLEFRIVTMFRIYPILNENISFIIKATFIRNKSQIDRFIYSVCFIYIALFYFIILVLKCQ